MRYLSVCSGVEAATVAWHGLGWQPVAFSEIEKFPSQVLAHHYPDVPNLGDMTKYKEWDFGTTGLDLLVGGTPCQSFSVAGLRKGIEDPRGNLALVYCGILDKFRPKWFVWENVPGVLSSGGGRDFGSLLGAMAELGYSCAYRVLDAQYFGVPQRRKRVFIVGYLGDWRNPAKVLFESDSLLRDTKKVRKTRQEPTSSAIPSVANCIQTTCHDYSRADGFNMIASGAFGKDISDTVTAKFAKGAELLQQGAQNGGNCVLQPIIYETHPADSRVKEMGDVCQTVTSRWGTGGGNLPLVQNVAYGFEPGIASREGSPSRFSKEMSPTLRANMGDNQVATAHAFKIRGGSGQGGKGYLGSDETAFTLSTMQDQQIAYSFDSLASNSMKSSNPVSGCREVELSKTIDTTYPCPSKNQGGIGIMQSMAVRRLTPKECERLQGFPDNYTNIKENCPDGPRYKAMGNSMAVPVMQWIGKRIQMVEDGSL
jgi:DNA (cytosine-5)-methyltransferase 1